MSLNPRNLGVCVSVVSHGHAVMLFDLLDDMAEAKSPVQEVLITLNETREDSTALRAFAAELPFPCKFIVNTAAKGYGENHNHAFSKAPRCEAFAVLNPDLRWPRNAHGKPFDPLAGLVQALKPKDVGVAAPSVVDSDGAREDSWRESLTPWRLFKRVFLNQREVAPKPDWAAGMCLLFRPEAFGALSGFDEGYFMYCEDMDLGLRLRDAGWRTAFCESTAVVHMARRASRRRVQHLMWHVQSLLRFWWLRWRRRRALRG